MAPYISVLIALYNHENYIARCLRSILDQSIDNSAYEIIVVDDCSSDGSTRVCEQFASKIIIRNNPKNIGLPASLNKGIAIAKGRFIVRLDSDDYVNRDFLYKLHEEITITGADAVACDYLIVDNDENVIKECNCAQMPIACGILFRKAHIEAIGGYNEQFKRHEDKEFRLRFDDHYSVRRLRKPLYRYRRHETNITNDVNVMEFFEKKLERIQSVDDEYGK